MRYLSAEAVCPMRESCYRYTAPMGLQQSFIEAPFNMVERSQQGQCPMFWRIKPKHKDKM